MSDRVPATCPSLDRLARIIKHLPEPHQSAARAEIEWLREAHLRLRASAADRDPGPLELLATIQRRGLYEAKVDALLRVVTDRLVQAC